MKLRIDFPDFRATQTSLQEAMAAFPTLAGNAALNFYTDSWRRRGYINTLYQPWKKTHANDDTRAILTQSGQLRRSLRLSVRGTSITISTNRKYAKAHNEGATQPITPKQRRFFWAKYAEATKNHSLGTKNPAAQKWKYMALAKTITIPQRQFMDIPNQPMSRFLEKRIVTNLERILSKLVG
jgi:phage gpG-like protein